MKYDARITWTKHTGNSAVKEELIVLRWNYTTNHNNDVTTNRSKAHLVRVIRNQKTLTVNIAKVSALTRCPLYRNLLFLRAEKLKQKVSAWVTMFLRRTNSMIASPFKKEI